MKKWRVLGQAFENIGSDLSMGCKNMETNCEVDAAFEELYTVYAMILDTLKAQRRFAAAKFDEIDKYNTSQSHIDPDRRSGESPSALLYIVPEGW